MENEKHDPTPPETHGLEQGQAHRSEAAAAGQTRLVDSHQAPNRGRTRDLAMFNLAIDSKLRGCDVVALRVEDVAPNGYALAKSDSGRIPWTPGASGQAP
jgi:hypothetical protein